MDSEKEKDLARLLAIDARTYFPLLNECFRKRLLIYAQKLTHNPEDAEDLVQETFTKAYRALTGGPAEKIECIHLWSWLHKILYNSFLDWKKKAKIPVVSQDIGYFSETLIDHLFEQPEEAAEHNEVCRSIQIYLKILPLELHKPIVLKYLHEHSYGEIAEELDLPVDKVRACVASGLRKLRKLRDAAPDEGNDEIT
jgi:RNA polymerase sigma factor (sigma-70 family)